MARVKGAMNARKKHKKVLKLAKEANYIDQQILS